LWLLTVRLILTDFLGLNEKWSNFQLLLMKQKSNAASGKLKFRNILGFLFPQMPTGEIRGST